MPTPPLQWSYLGQVGYEEALALQLRLREEIMAGRRPQILLLLEHGPVITLGRSARPDHVLVTDGERERRGVELVRVDRGGEVTYHGPGQLVGYPLRRVERAVKDHVRGMAASVTALLARRGIQSWWRDDLPGVWTRRGKIAAVGVDARGGVAMHGFALNVTTDLSAFEMIVPCGSPLPMTSIQAELGPEAGARPDRLDLPELAVELARELALAYCCRPERLEPADLW